jgi:hypothetical protein
MAHSILRRSLLSFVPSHRMNLFDLALDGHIGAKEAIHQNGFEILLSPLPVDEGSGHKT